MSEALCSGVYASDNTTDGGLVAQEVENTKSSGKYIKSKKKNTKSKSGKYKKQEMVASLHKRWGAKSCKVRVAV